MNGILSRSGVTLIGLIAVATAVLVAALTAPDDNVSSGLSGSTLEDPCDDVFSLEAEESPLVWYFGETHVPSELVEASSGTGVYCAAGFSAQGDTRNYDFAVTFVFREGDTRQEAVWWLFYPAWDDPIQWGAELRRQSGAAPSYHDGYVVAVSPNASDEIRQAAAATPNTDAWQVWFEGTSDLR